MSRFVVLLALVGIAAAGHFQVLDADDDHPLCKPLECNDNEMCVIEGDEATCVDQAELEQNIRAHGVKHSSHKIHKTRQEHAEHEGHGTHECSERELQQMGGRLLKWFSDVHTTVAGKDQSLKMHSVQCRPAVAWMFQQWDGNNDGLLAKSELRPLERGGNEVCTEQFIDKCDDIIVDGSISVDEWCDCFSFVDDLVHEPPCHKVRHAADPHLTGVFLPRCDLEGFYLTEQCHSGECWCVDRFGREFDQSRIAGHLPDCGQYASDMTEDDIAVLKARI